MKVLITLDYELFFGPESGTAQNCMIRPTRALLDILELYGIKLTVFVDSGYLIALEKQKSENRTLYADYQRVISQVRELADNGHEIGLHIHPHWEDSFWDGQRWVFDTSRYKLGDFDEGAITEMIDRHSQCLMKASGASVGVFRAGGWCIQPFPPIGQGLKNAGILMDSSIYPGGFYRSEHQHFDFREVPQYQTHYSFSEDPSRRDEKGDFTEVPISSMRISPLFFWKFALIKKLNLSQHRSFGDGTAIPMTRKQVMRLISGPSHSVVSIDGYKASYLEQAFGKYREKTAGKGNFVIIGHPKAFTPYSLKILARFVEKYEGKCEFITFRELVGGEHEESQS